MRFLFKYSTIFFAKPMRKMYKVQYDIIHTVKKGKKKKRKKKKSSAKIRVEYTARGKNFSFHTNTSRCVATSKMYFTSFSPLVRLRDLSVGINFREAGEDSCQDIGYTALHCKRRRRSRRSSSNRRSIPIGERERDKEKKRKKEVLSFEVERPFAIR